MNTPNYMQTPNNPGVNVNISNPSISPISPSAPPVNPPPVNLNALFSNSLLQPKHRVAQVNDEKEIYSVQMGVDSSDFVLHATKPLIYFVATDSSGNKTSIIPFDISQHIPEPEPTMQDVKAVEARFDEKLSLFKDEISDLISKKLEEALK